MEVTFELGYALDTVLVKVPGASHGIASRPSRLVGKIENIIGWFDKYLAD